MSWLCIIMHLHPSYVSGGGVENFPIAMGRMTPCNIFHSSPSLLYFDYFDSRAGLEYVLVWTGHRCLAVYEYV
jgi:hypothetical protein